MVLPRPGQHADPVRQQDQHQEFTQAAAALLRTHSPTDYQAARRRGQVPGRHSTTFGVFGPPETVVWVTDFVPDLAVRDDTVIVTAAGKKITVPVDTLPALRLLLSGQPATIADVTTRTGIDAAPLAEALITAGVCTETTPALAAGYDDWWSGSPLLFSSTA